MGVGLGVVAVFHAAHTWIPGWEWTLVGVALALVGVVHHRLAVYWNRRGEDLVRLLRAAADSTEPGDPKLKAPSLWGASSDLRVSVRELAESIRALKHDKRRAELVLANMADGIIAVDHARRITLFNRAAGVIFPEIGSGAVGARLEDAGLHPEIMRLVDECIARRADAFLEIKLPGWPQRVISIRATPFRSGGGSVDSAVVILHDLSDARRHEQNQKEFVSNVSHELKTPLTAVRTTAEALLGGAKNDEQIVDRFLNNIISESDRLSALIEDLMEIARMDSGITSTEKTDVDMAAAVNRALDAVRPQAAAKRVAISVDVEPGLLAYCDDVQVVQMIRNLADNAVKYTAEGGDVAVSARASGPGVVIAVADSGIGIPHGEVDRIFERFYRVDKARSRRLGGTGLGLAIVKEIVKAHGGEISVETQLGRGSTFTVTLPGRPEATGTG